MYWQDAVLGFRAEGFRRHTAASICRAGYLRLGLIAGVHIARSVHLAIYDHSGATVTALDLCAVVQCAEAHHQIALDGHIADSGGLWCVGGRRIGFY